MRAKLWWVALAALFVTAGVGCGGSKSKADTIDGGWAASDGIANNFDATGGVAVGMSATLCAFNPSTATAGLTTVGNTTTTTSYYSTLSCYLGTPSGTATPVALRVVGATDGSDFTMPVTASALPGWSQQVISWDPKNIRAGTNSYSVWYVMSDGSESNRSTVNLTFGSTTASGSVDIATAVISPNPAAVDLSLHNQYYDTALTFKLYVNSVDPASPVVRAKISQRYPARDYLVAIETPPTAAAWISLTITAPVQSAGDYTYDIVLETAAGNTSNTVTATVPILDSSQNPYGGTATISNAFFETNPVLIDFANAANTGTSTEKIFINNLPSQERVKAVWLKKVSDGTLGQAAITAQPAFPAWMSVNWTFYATAASGAPVLYDCWLEMEDDSVSNVVRLSIEFKQT